MLGMIKIKIMKNMNLYNKKLRDTLLMFIITFILLEVTFYFLLSSGLLYSAFYPTLSSHDKSNTFLNRGAYYDIFSGYKWQSGYTRVVRIWKGEIIFDNQFHANNYGYVSNQNYFPQKDENTYRIIVLGDSFTAGTMYGETWPDRLQALLNKNANNKYKYEVYSFALDGIGIDNWYRQFIYEIMPDFDFDAVMIASYVGDLFRVFVMSDQLEDQIVSGAVSLKSNNVYNQPNSYKEFFNFYQPKLSVGGWIKSDWEMDNIISSVKGWQWRKMDFYATKHLLNLFSSNDVDIFSEAYIKERETSFKQNKLKINKTYKKLRTIDMYDIKKELTTGELRFVQKMYKNRYFGTNQLGKFIKLYKIVQLCKQKNIPVILSAIPNRDVLLKRKTTGKDSQHQNEYHQLSKILKIHYFDGYRVFDSIKPDDITNKYWLKYDGHWNLLGSGHYANQLSPYLLSLFEKEKI